MAQTIPQPIGPWKVRTHCFRWTCNCTHRMTISFPVTYIWIFTDLSHRPYACPDHRVRPGALPGQAYGVHRLLPEHHWVRDGQHPFPEGRVWRVSILAPLSHFWLGSKEISKSFWVSNVWRISFFEHPADSWVGYEHSSFCGQQFVLEKGDYPRFEAYSGSNSYRIERMISFRPICCAVSFTHTITQCTQELQLTLKWI